VAFFGLATLWATFSKIWAIFKNLLITLEVMWLYGMLQPSLQLMDGCKHASLLQVEI
jgi:hypothetical protein